MKNVRKLTEGAILLAVFTVLMLMTIYIPIASLFLIFVLPLPFIMFSSKNSIKNISAFFLAAMFISYIAGSLVGLGQMLLFGSTGIVIGYMLQKNKSRSAILVAGSLIFMAGLVIFYAISAAFFKMDMIHEMTLMLKQSLKESSDMLQSMGQEDQIKKLKEQNDYMIKMLEILAPGFLIIFSIFFVFLTQLVNFPIAKRFDISVQPWGHIRNLSLPKSLLWYYLIAMGAKLLLNPHEGTYLYTVVMNAVYILEMFIFLQGLSLLFFLFHQKSIAKGLRVLGVILAFMIPIFHYIILILGITDLGFDFRKNFVKKE